MIISVFLSLSQSFIEFSIRRQCFYHGRNTVYLILIEIYYLFLGADNKVDHQKSKPPLNISFTEESKLSTPSKSDTPDSQATLRKLPPTPSPSGVHYHSTPESSQTESDDISPQIQRKRHAHARDKLPRFSISFDDESNTT